MDDEQRLVQKARKGDRRAFEMIVLRYQQPLVNYLGRTLGERETALDFAQDVFLKAYASLDSYHPPFKFSTWLFKIASNHVIDHWRKRKISALSLDRAFDDPCAPGLQVPDGQASVVKRYELAELRAKIERILAGIPEALRELFVLRHVNEFSYEEIAEIKQLPVGTVKNRVFQAKQIIRRKLGGTS
jgi:RNA polymerase sigma-70 factor (ECF subfamily)